jgi:hydroxymethylpyrimidine pyrophosphatase-like HAD family hydrolase
MIFASDLDRTIFYSNRALKELGVPEKLDLKPIEIKAGLPVGFMTEQSYLSLMELCRHTLFIPVTTRTTEQFGRFILFNTPCPTYAITSNGANIIYKGSLIADWRNDLLKQIKNETVEQGELLSKLKQEGFRFEGEKRQAEQLFFYYILNNPPSLMEKEAIKRTAFQHGWKVSLQGRKLYFIPNAINKGAALSFICNREGKEAYAGAGDSVLDWDFLQYCSHRFVPRHGELASIDGLYDLTLTKNSGAAAGEEILLQFLSLLRLKI